MSHIGMRNLFSSGSWSIVNGTKCSLTLGMKKEIIHKYSSMTPSMYVFDRTTKKIQRVSEVSVYL